MWLLRGFQIVLLVALFVAMASSGRPGTTTAAGISSVSSGGFHKCALTTVGGVKCWSFSTPVDVPGLSSGVAVVSTSWIHTCAVTTAGGVKCWGDNNAGQLGDGTETDSAAPVEVCADAACESALNGVVSVSAGFGQTCAVTTAGGVKCWGADLGDNSGGRSTTPVDVCADAACASPLSGVASVSAGGASCAVMTAGGVKCWGFNNNGQLGDGTETNRAAPVDVCADAACASSLSGVASVSVAVLHTCAVTTAGGVKCWGANKFGRMGVPASIFSSSTPLDVCAELGCASTLSGVSTVSAALFHTCAMTTTSQVKCWGYGGSGALGDDSTTTTSVPVDVCADAACATPLSDVTVVSAGGGTTNFSCAVAAGNVKCWGGTPSDVDGLKGSTPAGANVVVPFENVTLTFDEVKTGGTTSVTRSETGPAPPDSFMVAGAPSYYDISTTAVFNPSVHLCIDYEDPGNVVVELAYRILHDDGGGWVVLPVESLDAENDRICSSMDSLSTFLLGQEISVGGVAKLPAVAGASLEAGGGSRAGAGVLAGVAAAVTVSVLALGGAGWYARRRRAT